MSEIKENIPSGNCVISEDVIATIVSSAALEVDGVASMAQRPTDIRGFVGPSAARSVKVVTVNDETVIDLYLNLKVNYKIPDVSIEVQKKVKEEVQAMTGKPVTKINVHIVGIVFDEEVQEIEIENKTEEN